MLYVRLNAMSYLIVNHIMQPIVNNAEKHAFSDSFHSGVWSKAPLQKFRNKTTTTKTNLFLKIFNVKKALAHALLLFKYMFNICLGFCIPQWVRDRE